MLPWWKRRVFDGCLQMSCGRVQIWRYVVAQSLLRPSDERRNKASFLRKGSFMVLYAGRRRLLGMRLVIIFRWCDWRRSRWAMERSFLVAQYGADTVCLSSLYVSGA